MPLPLQPPPEPLAQVAPQALPELPLLPGSDPAILATYRWTLAHSSTLQDVVRRLAKADRKARFRLVPGFEERYDFLIVPTQEEYEIDIRVPILGWTRCEDALEPWIASALFLAVEIVEKERYRDRKATRELAFLKGSIQASFTFQRKVREELQAADPERLKNLREGSGIYVSRFAPSIFGARQRRALPAGIQAPAEFAPGGKTAGMPAAALVALVDRPITLPPLPKDAPDGRERFKAVHEQVGQALEDLKQGLIALYQRPEAGMALPADLSVPRELAVEGTDLLQVLADAEYRQLEQTFVDTWRGWQAAMVEQARLQAGKPPAARVPGSAAFENGWQAARQVLREPSRRFGAGYRLDPALLGWKEMEEARQSAAYLEEIDERPGARPMPMVREEVEGYRRQEDAVFGAQLRMAVAKQLLPVLSGAWTPMVDHLNRAALRVMNWEKASPDPADPMMEILRIHTRIALLERFRRAFWMGDLVWADTASAQPHPRPRPLNQARADQPKG
jgi:hypothetical protein